jgi:hypothetical protein
LTRESRHFIIIIINNNKSQSQDKRVSCGESDDVNRDVEKVKEFVFQNGTENQRQHRQRRTKKSV